MARKSTSKSSKSSNNDERWTDYDQNEVRSRLLEQKELKSNFNFNIETSSGGTEMITINSAVFDGLNSFLITARLARQVSQDYVLNKGQLDVISNLCDEYDISNEHIHAITAIMAVGDYCNQINFKSELVEQTLAYLDILRIKQATAQKRIHKIKIIGEKGDSVTITNKKVLAQSINSLYVPEYFEQLISKYNLISTISSSVQSTPIETANVTELKRKINTVFGRNYTQRETAIALLNYLTNHNLFTQLISTNGTIKNKPLVFISDVLCEFGIAEQNDNHKNPQKSQQEKIRGWLNTVISTFQERV